MGTFIQPKPRHFSHRFQFIDERKEQLRLLREEMSKDGVRKTEDKVSDRQERLHMLFAEAARQRRAKATQHDDGSMAMGCDHGNSCRSSPALAGRVGIG